MSYKKYNTRTSGRFNTTGQFVPEGGYGGEAPVRTLHSVQFNKAPNQPAAGQGYTSFQSSAPPPPPPAPKAVARPADVEMKEEPDAEDGADGGRPPWMKAKLQGVKKISNKERRRRQNENLRRLLTPKSALMVLNEIVPGEQVTNQFHVEAVGAVGGGPYFRAQAQNFCADLTLQGNQYKGYGENKLTARNAAAEQAVRDLILRKMAKVLMPEGRADEPGAGAEAEAEDEEETLPMIQLASFALHKLFAEWEYEGHRVPHLRHAGAAVSETASVASEGSPKPRPKPPKVKKLPEHAASMHPCMLLAFMRPQLEYKELGVEGDRPQNMLFTMGVDVDGTTYMGKASNKKEARKQAARAACSAVFGVDFDAPAEPALP